MKVIILSAIVFFLFSLPYSALGCGCPGVSNQTPEDIQVERQKKFDEATIVFSGEVIRANSFEAEFKVDKIWKGDSSDYIRMKTGVKDNGDGTASNNGCVFGNYKTGKKYLVYAYDKSNSLETYVCYGNIFSQNISEEIEGLEKIAPYKEVNKNF